MVPLSSSQSINQSSSQNTIPSYVSADKDRRFLRKQYGYRFLISSKGIGFKTSIVAIMLQVSSGLALLTLARTVADSLMLFVLPERQHYRRYKVRDR